MSLTTRIDNLERNRILNGNMDLCQRYGTLGSATQTQLGTTNQYVLDRFSTTGNQQYTVAQVADAPTRTQAGWNGIYSLKATVTSADASPGAGDSSLVRYFIEGYDYAGLHGRPVRLQFWVKATGTNVTGTYSLNLRNGGANRSFTTTYSIPTAGVWTQITLDVQLDSGGTWNFDANQGLNINWFLLAGSSFQTSTLNTWQVAAALAANTQTNLFNTNGNTFQITQVALIPQDFTQAGVSNVAVPFQRAGRTLGHELQMCQRYYQKSYNQSVAPGTSTDTSAVWGHASVHANGNCYIPILYKTTMRATPNAVQAYDSSGSSSLIGYQLNGVAQSAVSIGAGGAYIGEATGAFIIAPGTGAHGQTVMVEFHWTAEADF